MTRDHVIRMAREAGLSITPPRSGQYDGGRLGGDVVSLERFAALAVEHERSARIAAQTENEALKARLAGSGVAEPVQGPVAWEWRWLDANPNTVTFGQWSEWKRVEPRNALCTVEDSLNEFKAYIANGSRYELRALFTTPQAQQPRKAVKLTPEEMALMWVNESFDTMTHESCYVRGVKRGESAVLEKNGWTECQ